MAQINEIKNIIRADDQTRAAIESAKRNLGDFEKNNLTATERMQQQWIKFQKVVAATAAAFYTAMKAFDLAERAAKFHQSMQSFNLMVAEMGRNAEVEFARIRAASANLIDKQSLVEATNRAMSLGIPIENIGNLMEIARAKARDMGLTTSKAFEDLVTGIGRASPQIIDNLGLTLKIGEANEAYAKKIHKTVEQLTAQEKKTAVLNAVLEEGTKALERHNLEMLTTYERMQAFKSQLQDIKLAIGNFITRVGMGLVATFQWISAGALTLVTYLLAIPAGLEEITDYLGITNSETKKWASEMQNAFAAAEELTGKSVENFKLMISSIDNLMGTAGGGEISSPEVTPPDNSDAMAALAEQHEIQKVLEAQWAEEDAQNAYERQALIEYYENLAKEEARQEELQNLELMEYAKAYYRQKEIDEERKKRAIILNLSSQTFGNMASMAYSFYQLSEKQSRTAFKAYQAMAIAQTVIDTYKAAQGAYSALAGIPIVGPALGAAAAAAAIVAGMARVQAIASQQIGGGAAVAPTGAGASYNPVTATSPAQGINAQGAAPSGPSIKIEFHGDVYGDADDLVQRITPALEEAFSDKRLSFSRA